MAVVLNLFTDGVTRLLSTLAGLPQAAQTFFGEPVIVTALSALLLNTFAPGEQSPLVGPESSGDALAPSED